MKTQTKIKRILESEISDSLKVLKLQTLALKTFVNSPTHKLVIAHYEALQAGDQFNGTVEDFYAN